MTDDTAVLVLQLAAPLQSWGSSSRFTRRTTNAEPTKSGLVGMLASAQGRRRSDPIEDLVSLRFGVRIDRPGVLEPDFQTAIRREPVRGGGVRLVSMPLSHRFYLSDAVFVAAVEGPRSVLDGLADAVRRPRHPLALGRRSCPPAGGIPVEVVLTTLEEAMRTVPWRGAYRSAPRGWQPPERLHVVRDLALGESREAAEREHDVPLSFDPEHRKFGWRWVRREWVPNPSLEAVGAFRHDAFGEVD